MLTPSLEDYLEEIYRLSLGENAVRVTDVAARLGVKLPSVTKALRRLHEEDYLTYRRYKDVILSEKGRRLGKFLVERNAILQEFLTVLDVSCGREQEAEAMEHYLSLPTIRAIDYLVRFFKANPACLGEFHIFKTAQEQRGDVLDDGYKD
ncbi:metal-dependent transcriptional regulator [Desulforudis sp. 1088]|uniref:metal-dependent transcriptional regulator n=1 Tax=unclassified Candidatus Desulforudis TaxID=2635950 RepID=UPI00347C7D8D